MTNCARCGALLGLGRYCTNCGARADQPALAAEEPAAEQTIERRPVVHPSADPTATAERPAVSGPSRLDPPPPPPLPLPGGSRYPLYADEVAAAPGPAAGAIPPILTPSHRQDRRRAGSPWLVVLLVVCLLLLVALGGWLLLRGGDGDRAGSADPAPTPTAGATDEADAASPEPSDPAARPQEDLTDDVEVEAPRPAPPGRDLAGRRVTYRTSNLFDGRGDTAYRMAGDATGTVLTFRLPETRTVTMVGLINGYAKTDGGVDWYPRQHRITRVAWVFDDGTRVEQDLKLTREIQQLAVSVETRSVELHILETRGPGDISRARNATSISEVTLQGS